MKLYVSRYQNPALKEAQLVVLGITIGTPRWKLGYPVVRLPLLAPDRETFHVYDRSQFEPLYWRKLDEIGLQTIEQAIQEATGGRDAALCCFEDTRQTWCHRQCFAEWWTRHTGQVIEEYPDPSEPKQPKERKPEARKEPVAIQGRFQW
jgi:hypothetical protein